MWRKEKRKARAVLCKLLCSDAVVWPLFDTFSQPQALLAHALLHPKPLKAALLLLWRGCERRRQSSLLFADHRCTSNTTPSCVSPSPYAMPTARVAPLPSRSSLCSAAMLLAPAVDGSGRPYASAVDPQTH